MERGERRSKRSRSIAQKSVPSGQPRLARSNSRRCGQPIIGSVKSVSRCACGCARQSAVSA
eukprot:473547-Prymnesium_polylepis.2